MSNVQTSFWRCLRHVLFVGLAIVSIGLVGASPASAQQPSFTETNCAPYSDSVSRLYTAAFSRQPEAAGFDYWLGQYSSGAQSLPAIAEFFASSAEFDATYGALNNRAFVEQLYRNVLGRGGDLEGIDFWTEQLRSGSTRGEILLRFSESPENVTISGTAVPALDFYNQGMQSRFVCLMPGESFEFGGGEMTQPVRCEALMDGVRCDPVVRAFDQPFSECLLSVYANSIESNWECPLDKPATATQDVVFGTSVFVGSTSCVVDDFVECANEYDIGFYTNGNFVGFFPHPESPFGD